MRITLNLASRPFFELRPLFLRLRILAAALVGLALILFFFLQIAERKAAKADAAVRNWTVATQNLQREWTMDQSLMREPVNAATLDRSQFLNQQFVRKSFSWTTALMDLELVLPQGVQVISIDPRMSKEGHVLVRLVVSGPRDKAVELVANLEKSPHFLDPRVAGESTEVEGQNRAGFRPTMSASIDVNVDILAEFNAGDLASTDKKAEETKSGTHAMGETEPAANAAASKEPIRNAPATNTTPAMHSRMSSHAGRRGNASHGVAGGAR
jgi:type IV pilus assembly protein PilN